MLPETGQADKNLPLPAGRTADQSAGPRTPRYEVNAEVIAHQQIVGHEFEIIFHAPAIARAARPGQFIELLFGDSYVPLVRRPFSLYRVDREAGVCSVLYLARGSFTSGLAQKQVGDTVSLLGPLGRPFQWQRDTAARHILIAGGIGAPPLYFLAREISKTIPPGRTQEPGVIVINAARTEALLVGLAEFGELEILLHVITDDGSRGQRGMATDLLTALLDRDTEQGIPTCLYSCGPMPMLRAVAEIAIARTLPCQISIETSMPCGIGICQGCAVPVRASASTAGFSYALACVEGPVFEARDLLWR